VPARSYAVIQWGDAVNAESLSVTLVGAGWLCSAELRRLLPRRALAGPAGERWYTHQRVSGKQFHPQHCHQRIGVWQADTFDLPTIDSTNWDGGRSGHEHMRVFLHNFYAAGPPRLSSPDGSISSSRRQAPYSIMLGSAGLGLGSVSEARPPARPETSLSQLRLGTGSGCGDTENEAALDQELKPYVVGVISHFRDDPRVLMWT